MELSTRKLRKGEIMTSAKKAEANRRNSLKSTGPKTPEGKAAIRLNATKHGLLSQDVLLPGENEAALKELGERLREELQPVGELENLLVERVIASTWRLRRLGRVEAGIFARELYGELAERARREASIYTRTVNSDDEFMAQFLSRTIITDEQKHQEAVESDREMESVRDGELATLGQTFIRDANEANAFSKLSRYESAIERSLYKALHELQRLQAARGTGGNVSPPMAVDVEVSGVPREDL
jgi:hypothetical protein